VNVPRLLSLACLLFLSFQASNAWVATTTTTTTKTRLHHSSSFSTDAVSSTRHAATSRSSTVRLSTTTTNQESLREEHSLEENSQSRRAWFQSLAKQALWTAAASSAAWGAPRPYPALAALPDVVSSKAVCDPTVTVWQRDGERLLYLLGTAHISEISAELAASLVRDTLPNAVFVELDLKRVGRLPPPQARAVSDALPAATSPDALAAPPGTTRVVIPAVVPTTAMISTESAAAAASFSSDLAIGSSEGATSGAGEAALAPPRRPNWFQRRAMDFATGAVGSALKGMYSNLGEAGFKPGEEFAAAIREGQRIGASIVLGDQDVEFTLRRLTQALAATDLNKLLNPDAEFEKTLSDLMGGGGDSSIMGPAPQDFDDPAKFKAAFAAYVEKLKDRRNIAKVMGKLNEVAPALVQVMLTERDAFMATGIDTLNDFECMVAVMGLAHLDGVERNLKQRGWRQVRPKC